jgi:hypothetical protein
MKTEHVPHHDKNIAYHMDWAFRREAAIWTNEKPFAPNLYPVAEELREWMLNEGDLKFLGHVDKTRPNAPTNPYTYHSYVLARIIADIINQLHGFATGSDKIDEQEAEITFLRFYGEFALHSARVCEALIKQLLYCTTFLEGEYKRAALGELLVRNCSGCAPSKEKRHKLSLLGSLAHRYQLCAGFEKCVSEHMKLVNRRRNLEAAHSGTVEFMGRTLERSRADALKCGNDLGEELLHMLQHLAEIEVKVLEEMWTHIQIDSLLHFLPLPEGASNEVTLEEVYRSRHDLSAEAPLPKVPKRKKAISE